MLRWTSALLVATACESAWASKFASGLEGVFYLIVLGATGGAASIVAACLGRSRSALAIGLPVVAAACFHWAMPLPLVLGESAANRLPAAVAAALGYGLGWTLTRWKRLRRAAVLAILIQNALAFVLYFGEPILGLLCACLSALTLPLLVAIGLRRGWESLRGQQLSESGHRPDATAALEGMQALLLRLRCTLLGAAPSGLHRARRTVAYGVASAVAAIGRSRLRRAYATGFALYLGGFALIASDSEVLRHVTGWAMRPGRVLHAMLVGDLPLPPEPVALAWSLYGLVCSAAAGFATLGLPLRPAPPVGAARG
jgi:hypothetical protein